MHWKKTQERIRGESEAEGERRRQPSRRQPEKGKEKRKAARYQWMKKTTEWCARLIREVRTGRTPDVDASAAEKDRGKSAAPEIAKLHTEPWQRQGHSSQLNQPSTSKTKVETKER